MASLNVALGSVKVEAVTLQASSSTNAYTASAGDMWTAIREMETGTLGNTSGLDCHMEKRTEFGAAALLAISAYGAGSTQFAGSSKSISSTGNASGIYQLAAGNYEYNAACYYNPSDAAKTSMGALWTAGGAQEKYLNLYYDNSLETYIANNNGEHGMYKGDALFARGFLGSGNAYWVSASYPVFGRHTSGLFSCSNATGANSGASRAVVVCGAGL